MKSNHSHHNMSLVTPHNYPSPCTHYNMYTAMYITGPHLNNKIFDMQNKNIKFNKTIISTDLNCSIYRKSIVMYLQKDTSKTGINATLDPNLKLIKLNVSLKKSLKMENIKFAIHSLYTNINLDSKLAQWKSMVSTNSCCYGHISLLVFLWWYYGFVTRSRPLFKLAFLSDFLIRVIILFCLQF